MKSILILVEVIVLTALFYFILSQILVPAFRGTAMFPFFRREAKIKEAIVEAKQDLREDELEDELEKLEEKRHKAD